MVLTWERLSVPFCDITEGLAVHFTTDIIVYGAGNVDFTISIVVHQLPPSDLHTGTLKKKKKYRPEGRLAICSNQLSVVLCQTKHLHSSLQPPRCSSADTLVLIALPLSG